MGKADTPRPGSSVFCGIGVPFGQAYAVIGLKMSCELITVPSPIDEGAASFSSLASRGEEDGILSGPFDTSGWVLPF